MARASPEALSRPFRESRAYTRPQVKTCDHPECREEGAYRAPQARDRLNEYYWFCLDHVRAYNRAWNYYAGMDENEIETERRRDSTWHRPSWPLGSMGKHRGRAHFRDDFGFFSEEAEEEEQDRRRWEENRDRHRRDKAHDSAEKQALAEMDLAPPIDFDAIKARYKTLVKKLHPDVNGGDHSLEDKLKAVNQAYATLRNAYAR